MNTLTAEQVVFEAWQRNGQVNGSLLAHLTPEHLGFADPAGGWTIGQHLCDMLDFRKDWMSRIAPAHAARLTFLHEVVEGGFRPRTTDPGQIHPLFVQADQVAREAVQEKLDSKSNFSGVYESHPLMFLQHAIVHDSHHRGQILMVLRLNGAPWTEADGPTWAPWRD